VRGVIKEHENRRIAMNDKMLVVVIVAVAVVAVVVIAMMLRQQAKRKRSEHLRRSFGPEYDRAVADYGGYAAAEKALEERQARSRNIVLQPLSLEDKDRFSRDWRSVQAHFVDAPGKAVIEADQLLEKLISKRGYPVEDFEQQARDISVCHPKVVANYRTAHLIADRQRRSQASTEDLREALIQYRVLYEELLGNHSPILKEVTQ
jgi:type II secretory pathway component PulK